jgi:hypothetical protein
MATPKTFDLKDPKLRATVERLLNDHADLIRNAVETANEDAWNQVRFDRAEILLDEARVRRHEAFDAAAVVLSGGSSDREILRHSPAVKEAVARILSADRPEDAALTNFRDACADVGAAERELEAAVEEDCRQSGAIFRKRSRLKARRAALFARALGISAKSIPHFLA